MATKRHKNAQRLAFFLGDFLCLFVAIVLAAGCGWSLGAACAPGGSTLFLFAADLLNKEMKGPQGLGDSGAEASNEAREVCGPRVSELLLSAFADRPPYRRTQQSVRTWRIPRLGPAAHRG
jgi:hypothetical protein